jgi:hypothetical protein
MMDIATRLGLASLAAAILVSTPVQSAEDAHATCRPHHIRAGPWQQCNVQLDVKPALDAATRILEVVNGLIPAGQTPLSKSVL